jgi:hypothetical protein
MANSNRSGSKTSSLAARTLGSSSASGVQKSLAASVLSQTGTNRVTGKALEAIASAALRNPNSSPVTQQLAGSVVSQSSKTR